MEGLLIISSENKAPSLLLLHQTRPPFPRPRHGSRCYSQPSCRHFNQQEGGIKGQHRRAFFQGNFLKAATKHFCFSLLARIQSQSHKQLPGRLENVVFILGSHMHRKKKLEVLKREEEKSKCLTVSTTIKKEKSFLKEPWQSPSYISLARTGSHGHPQLREASKGKVWVLMFWDGK